MLDRLRNYGVVVGPQWNLVVAPPLKKENFERNDVYKGDLVKVARAHYNAQLATWRPHEEERRRKRALAKEERRDKMQYCSRCSCESCVARRRKL